MRFSVVRLLVVLGFLSLLLAAVPAQPSARAADAATMIFNDGANVTIDGVVGAQEYPAASHYADPTTGMDVYLIHDDGNVTGAVSATALGWVAVGIGPAGTVMDGSNIIIGYVAGGTAYVSDQFGVGYDHKSDVSLGGQDNVLASAGTETGGKTTIEFRIPLDSGDPYDVALKPSTSYSLIVAYQSTADDFTTMHTAAGLASVYVQPDPNRIPTRHASLSFGAEGDPVAGQNTTLLADLLGDNGTPRYPADIGFYVNTSVGWGYLGSAPVDALGHVGYNYTFLSPGPFEFRAVFPGDQEYLPAEANLTVLASPAAAAPEGLTALQIGHILMITVLASVLLVYAYSMGQVFRIRSTGRVPPPAIEEPEASSKEAGGPGEAEAREESEKGERR